MFSSTNKNIETVHIFARSPINCTIEIEDRYYVQKFSLTQSNWIQVKIKGEPNIENSTQNKKESIFMVVQKLAIPISVNSSVSWAFYIKRDTQSIQLANWIIKHVPFVKKQSIFCTGKQIAHLGSDDVLSLFNQKLVRTIFANKSHWVEFVLPK